MGELIFVVGGAGSGKSAFALEMAKNHAEKAVFVATSASEDKEMERKIKNHQKERPAHWNTIEAAATPFDIIWRNGKMSCLLVDSLTLWVSTLLMKRAGRDVIIQKCESFLRGAQAKFKQTIVVSDEVGLGIVPSTRLARDFREILGAVNQQAAEIADRVFLISVGLPVQLKGQRSAVSDRLSAKTGKKL